jgi:hypothetical protein
MSWKVMVGFNTQMVLYTRVIGGSLTKSKLSMAKESLRFLVLGIISSARSVIVVNGKMIRWMDMEHTNTRAGLYM